jgi:hypothetical protein
MCETVEAECDWRANSVLVLLRILNCTQDRQCTYNVTLRRFNVRVAIVSVEKQ